jgi:RHS repeat-associated protein
LTNNAGAVSDTYRYRAFGKEISHTGGSSSPFTFVGRWGYNYDSTAGLYQARRRWLDPDTGTWLSKDPIDLLLSDTNRYRYANNNPVGLIDPSGELAPALLFLFKGLLATGAGAAIGGAGNALWALATCGDPVAAAKSGLKFGAIGGATGFLVASGVAAVAPAWVPGWLVGGISGSAADSATELITTGEVSTETVLIGFATGVIGSLFAGKPTKNSPVPSERVDLRTGVDDLASSAVVEVSGDTATISIGSVRKPTAAQLANQVESALSEHPGVKTVIINSGPVVEDKLQVVLGQAAQSGQEVLGASVTITSDKGALAPQFSLEFKNGLPSAALLELFL